MKGRMLLIAYAITLLFWGTANATALSGVLEFSGSLEGSKYTAAGLDVASSTHFVYTEGHMSTAAASGVTVYDIDFTNLGKFIDLNGTSISFTLKQLFGAGTSSDIVGNGVFSGAGLNGDVYGDISIHVGRGSYLATISVPEPGTIVLMALGLALIGLSVWKRKKCVDFASAA